MAKTHMKAGHQTLNCQKQPMTPKPNHHVQNIEFKNVKDWATVFSGKFGHRETNTHYQDSKSSNRSLMKGNLQKKQGRMAVFPGKGTEFGKI
ncbi:hypothetical protein ERO13_D13G189350v2, partial [Gossypium hirsutum]